MIIKSGVYSMNKCIKLLAKKKLSITFLESASAGYLAYRFSQNKYSGDILYGGLVCYDMGVKENILKIKPNGNISATHESSVICGPIGCAVDFLCRLLHLKIISLKNPLQIGLCNKALKRLKTLYIVKFTI